ncbi:VOC family protein [Methylobacterium sp. C33D]|uniref:VOC family protein n=1 Tax=Methylobacterium mesophilicum TaxID=39956 RepID=UPI002F325508
MAVRRIVTDIRAMQVEAARAFYGDVLGLEVVMDHGWILTFAAPGISATPQISVASTGGSGTPVPDISVEVDDLADVRARVRRAGLPVLCGPAREPWGVERFYVRDPFDRLVNIVAHRA